MLLWLFSLRDQGHDKDPAYPVYQHHDFIFVGFVDGVGDLVDEVYNLSQYGDYSDRIIDVLIKLDLILLRHAFPQLSLVVLHLLLLSGERFDTSIYFKKGATAYFGWSLRYWTIFDGVQGVLWHLFVLWTWFNCHEIGLIQCVGPF